MPERAANSAATASVLLEVLPEIIHEMSQPMGVLRCGIEVTLMQPQPDGPRTEMRTWLQQTEQLSMLLEVLRELLEIESANAESVACELGGLIRAIVNDLRAVAESRGVGLRVESPHPLNARACDHHMYSALQTVLTHAIERAGEGRCVHVALRAVKGEAWISIAGLRPQPGEWRWRGARSTNGADRASGKAVWPLVLARCAIERAGGMVQCDAAAGGDGNLLIRLPLAR